MTGQPGGVRALRELAGLALLALGAFAAVAAALGAVLPDEVWMEDRSRAKETLWRTRPGEFDIAYFGSSRVQVGLVPGHVDARLAERGFPLRSFNFGLRGAQSFETDWLLRRVVAARDPRLRFVVIELPDWSLDMSNIDTERSVAWHDLRQVTGILWALRGNLTLLEQLRSGAMHLKLFAMHTTNLGVGPPAVEERSPRSRATLASLVAEVASTSGHRLRSDTKLAPRRGRRLARFLGRADEYEEKVAALRAGAEREEVEARYPIELLRRQRAFLRDHGIEVVYLVPPVPASTAWAEALLRDGEIPVLLRFNDPERYPELLALEAHFDEDHVNAEGARLFSQRFADAFADLLAGGTLEPR